VCNSGFASAVVSNFLASCQNSRFEMNRLTVVVLWPSGA